MVLAIVAPGQGSQTPRFLAPWLELPGAGEQLDALAEVADVDLRAAGTEWDEEAIRDTAVAQPLLVAAGLVSLNALRAERPLSGAVLAGHSVGEITAATAAGVLTPEDAMQFVRVRALGMAHAASQTPTGMSAVLGGDPAEVESKLKGADLTPANVNGGGQVVAAGTLGQLEALKDDPPAKARVIPLKVAGAFHTHHMAPAIEELATLAAGLNPKDPRVALLSNADGTVVTSGQEYLKRLVSQVANPVRWDLCMSTMVEQGVTAMIELSPAGTLVGLARRGMKGVETLALKTPEDLDRARQLISEHSGEDS